jgi:hypothetical protein
MTVLEDGHDTYKSLRITDEQLASVEADESGGVVARALQLAVQEGALGLAEMRGDALDPHTLKFGDLVPRLNLPRGEIEGIRHLFVGAFRAYRNRAAHTVAGYSLDEAWGIIHLVNLLLLILRQVEQAPEPLWFWRYLTNWGARRANVWMNFYRRCRKWVSDAGRASPQSLSGPGCSTRPLLGKHRGHIF